MKKLIILLSTLGFTTISFAQDADSLSIYRLPRNIFKINPTAFGTSSLQADYELFFDRDKMSLQFSPSGTIYKDNHDDAYGFGGEVTYRKYLRDVIGNGKKHQTLGYFYGSLGYNYYEAKHTTIEETNTYWSSQASAYVTETVEGEVYREYIHKYSANIGFGVQFLVKRMISMDVNLGGGLRLANSNLSETFWDGWAGDYGYTGFVPELGISFGIVGDK